eukprot:351375-Chlamydomonas_euryale.AAC.4
MAVCPHVLAHQSTCSKVEPVSQQDVKVIDVHEIHTAVEKQRTLHCQLHLAEDSSCSQVA